jgi:hypothetical protein
MDRIDVFAYRRTQPFDTVEAYLVAELKRGTATGDDVTQLMKYVDWTAREYCGGDYSMIDAYLVAHEFDPTVKNTISESARRDYTIGARPPSAQSWSRLRCVEYRADARSGKLSFRNGH